MTSSVFIVKSVYLKKYMNVIHNVCFIHILFSQILQFFSLFYTIILLKKGLFLKQSKKHVKSAGFPYYMSEYMKTNLNQYQSLIFFTGNR